HPGQGRLRPAMTARRILVLGAGTAAAENLIGNLKSADGSLPLLGAHDDRFVLKRSSAQARFVLPSPKSGDFVPRLAALVRSERLRLVTPTSDHPVLALPLARRRLPGAVFLPSHAVVTLCRDKLALGRTLRARGLPAPATCAVGSLRGLDRAFARFPQ